MFRKVLLLTTVQIVLIYLFALEQNVELDDIILPFGMVMIVISIVVTFTQGGSSEKQNGISESKYTENNVRKNISLYNTFFLASVFLMVLAILTNLV